MEKCKKHNLTLKNRKDKKGKYCPNCIYTGCGPGDNPPWDHMDLKKKNKSKPSKKGIKGRK